MERVFMEPELTSAKISDLTKIPTKDFEKQFREWMERDDVARSLQAKLRCDLIANFNKTTLGRHIMAQTTMTTSGVYGSGPRTQRLTLSPLVLALNTLVAEFLYAENCHFSLSVFCTEVPFRNTLPDFEQKPTFRFTTSEVQEILDAVTGVWNLEQQFKKNIIKNYTQSNTNISLLMLLLKYLIELATKTTKSKTQAESTQTIEISPKPTTVAAKSTAQTTTFKIARANQSFYTKNSGFQQFNKYLLLLSRKVGTMLTQLEFVQKPKDMNAKKTVYPLRYAKRYTYLNRSLESMTRQLRKMSQGKYYNKQMKDLLQSISLLGKQFENCANSFSQISKELKSKQEVTHSSAGVNTSRVIYANKETSTSNKTADHNSYAQWLHDFRETRNGRKFLDRVQNSLRKALHNQRHEIQTENNIRLEHQKALLKIHYKQKLIEHIAKLPQPEALNNVHKLQNILEEQVKQLKLQQNLLSKNNNNSMEIKGTAETNHFVVQEHQIQNTGELNISSKPQTIDCDKLKQIHTAMKDLELQDPSLENLVFDAKLRLLELDEESNQLENEFFKYLESQRLEIKATSNAAVNIWQRCQSEGQKIPENLDLMNNESDEEIKMLTSRENYLQEQKLLKQNTRPTKENIAKLTEVSLKENPGEKKKNVILEAKQKFFEDGQRKKQHIIEIEDLIAQQNQEVNENLNLHSDLHDKSRLTINFRNPTKCLDTSIKQIAVQNMSQLKLLNVHKINNTEMIPTEMNCSSSEISNEYQITSEHNDLMKESEEINIEEKKKQTAAILQRSTQKLNKLFAANLTEKQKVEESIPENVDQTFIKEK